MTDWDSSVRQMSAVEAFVTRAASRMDTALAAIAKHQRWPLLVGILAVALSLIAHTPVRSLFRDVGNQWYSDVLLRQIDHPLSPIDYESYRDIAAASGDPGSFTHIDKTAFRISIPLLGKIFHTGAASYLIMNYLAGFLFFPMLVVVANRIFVDRIVAVYITLAFALSWAGSHFFNDSDLGDGFAYFWLLASIYFNRAGLIFVSVLIAAFTDERALIGSAAAVLYFLGRTRELTRRDTTALMAISSVVAAWIAYFAIRDYMIFGLGFRTGIATMFNSQIVWYNLAQRIPYAALTVFQGLWIWLPIGLLALWLRRSIVETLGFAGLTILMLAVALAVWDFQRSLGYMLLLLPVGWQSAALSERANRSISRGCFVLGLSLIVPFNTVLRYLYSGPVLAGFG
jgi:hypothetical protein